MAALDLDSKTFLEAECVPSHIVNLRGLLKPISSVKWKKDSWMSHLFGTILKPSHTNRFTDWWTSSLRDTLASRSLPQENEQEKKTLATSGLGSQTEFDFFNQECVFSRTSKDTSVLDSERSLENWNQWVTRCRGEYSVRVKSAHLIRESECSSWPSPRLNMHKGASMGCCGGRIEKTGYHGSIEEAGYLAEHSGLPDPENPSTDGNRQELWATPRSAMASMHPEYGEHWNDKRGGESIATQVWKEEQWATPTARDHKSGRGNEEREYKELTPMVERTQAGKLNPRWVETLMGLPIGWTMPSCKSPVTTVQTNSGCLETESCQQQQNEHSELFGRNSND